MIVQYVLLSLLFLFVYTWFRADERKERFIYLIAYLVQCTVPVFYGIEMAHLTLALLLMVMNIHWLVGFKHDVFTVSE